MYGKRAWSPPATRRYSGPCRNTTAADVVRFAFWNQGSGGGQSTRHGVDAVSLVGTTRFWLATSGGPGLVRWRSRKAGLKMRLSRHGLHQDDPPAPVFKFAWPGRGRHHNNQGLESRWFGPGLSRRPNLRLALVRRWPGANRRRVERQKGGAGTVGNQASNELELAASWDTSREACQRPLCEMMTDCG